VHVDDSLATKPLMTMPSKVAVYKYHTNEFVYKSEGVGAIAGSVFRNL
jgi:hypothetical protein